jgi:hypothetical protein
MALCFALAGCASPIGERPVEVPSRASSIPAPQAPLLSTLPPASGTAIGIIIDERTMLGLRPDQVARLRVLDSQLSLKADEPDYSLDEAATLAEVSELLLPEQRNAVANLLSSRGARVRIPAGWLKEPLRQGR